MLATMKPRGPKRPWLAYAALYRDPLGYLTRAARKHGDIVHLKIGRKSDFLLNHPDLIRAALLDHESAAVRAPPTATRPWDGLADLPRREA